MNKNVFQSALLLLLFSTIGIAQRDYRVHVRGMLHETEFNTGEIGRAYDQGTGGSILGMPSFEWPGNSSVDIDGVQYNGQYNSFGGGLYLAYSRRDASDRFYSFCGGMAGEPTAERYAFPIELRRTENYPVLSNGDLNPNYNPDEAEEIIVSKWTTNIGITVTRTSRAWSHPDYDDFIIYEYELENTGVIGRNFATRHDTLLDVMAGFAYALNPSMFGYERTFNRWDATDMGTRDLYPRFNINRWMNYCIDGDGKPDPRYFSEWAKSGKCGGGLLSPQAVGFLPLYYDSDHLAVRGQTAIQMSDSSRIFDANSRVKQPYLNRMETGLMSLAKAQAYLDNGLVRKNTTYSGGYYPYRQLYWTGRGSYNWRQSNKFGIGHIFVFGPYKMLPGDKIRFAVAEVAGYGAARLHEWPKDVLWDEGGGCGENCTETDAVFSYNPVPNWSKPITWGGGGHNFWTQGAAYLDTTGSPTGTKLPEYVNSGVVTIRDVADRAIQLYTGARLKKYDGYVDSVQFKPENSPSTGAYHIPIVVPAPIFSMATDSVARNIISWGPQVESFTAPRLQAAFNHYEVSKANNPLGPWSVLDTVTAGDPRYFKNGTYRMLDTSVHEGEAFYYSIRSVDVTGRKSGRTQTVLYQTRMPGTENLEKVYVVPNPFIVHSGFEGVTGAGANADQKIGFYHLPKKCTIHVFSYSGQLITTLEHDSGFYSEEFMQITRNNQVLASGVYFFVIDTPKGERSHGKFVIIK